MDPNETLNTQPLANQPSFQAPPSVVTPEKPAVTPPPAEGFPAPSLSGSAMPPGPPPISNSEMPAPFETHKVEEVVPMTVGVPPVIPPAGKKTLLKKLVPILLGVLVLLFGFFLVFKFFFPKSPSNKKITLTYWGLWEPEGVLGGTIADFQKENPNITIDYVRKTSLEYRERLTSAFASNKGPDIFRFHNTWVPMFRHDLAPIPSKIMDNATFETLFYPVVRQDLRVGNSYVGIPLEIDGLAMFINKEIFRTAGKTPPKTWEELKVVAQELTVPAKRSKGEIQIAGAALGRTENIDHWSDILAVMMLQNGADLANPAYCRPDPSTGREDCYGPDALTFFTFFSRQALVWDETLPSSTRHFASGRVAIYFGPSWEVFTIKEMNPQLNFEVLSIPQLDETNITWASYWVEGVSKKSPNQEAAWKFLKYLSEKETMQKLYKVQSDTRIFGEPYSRIDLADLIKDTDYVGAYLRQATVARSWYLSSRTFDNGINDKIIKYFGDAVNAVNMGASAKDALGTTATGVGQVLSQYGVSASAR